MSTALSTAATNDFWTLKAATTAFTYVLALTFLILNAAVIWKIATDRINLGTLLLENDGSGKTSMSRFQLLVFTLVIAGLFAVLSIENGSFIDVPNGTLALLGISGGSFLISKGIGTPEGRAMENAAKPPPGDTIILPKDQKM